MYHICVNCLWHDNLELDNGIKECICICDEASEEESHNAYCTDEYYGANLVTCKWFSSK